MVDFITWLIAIKRVVLQFSNTFKSKLAFLWSYKIFGMRWFKYSFCNSVYSCFKNFCRFVNTLLHIPIIMRNKVKTIFNIQFKFFSLKLKNIIWCLPQGHFCFQMVIFTMLFWRCPTLWKSMLKMITLFWRCLTLFKSTVK